MLDLPRDDGDLKYPPPEPEQTYHYLYILEIQSTEKDQAKIDQEAAIRLDHSFRNRFQLSHAEMWQGTQMDQDYGLAPRYIKLRTVQFDPVLADGEPPPNYEPHTMPVVDHRRKL